MLFMIVIILKAYKIKVQGISEIKKIVIKKIKKEKDISIE